MFSPIETGSPAYVFDLDCFAKRAAAIKEMLGDIPLTYSMKANTFLLNRIPKEIRHIEVCSPGELDTCIAMGIFPGNIIYSGVNKQQKDVEKAVAYGVDWLTAESLLHVALEQQAVKKQFPGEKRKVMLRLTGGNQFGMSAEDIYSVFARREELDALEICGIHYFTGTQKKLRQITKDLVRLEKFLEELRSRYGFEPLMVEYGPGASVSYFDNPSDEIELKEFEEAAAAIRDLAKRWPVGIEMGRFLAAGCGSFVTQVKDSKSNSDTNYLICDAGIHHLNYYGQNLAMRIPRIDVYAKDGVTKCRDEKNSTPYMLCGSLCTTADILVREIELPHMEIGDYIVFRRCGAYSVTEGPMLFLSRTMPRIYTYTEEQGLQLAREFVETSILNRNMNL